MIYYDIHLFNWWSNEEQEKQNIVEEGRDEISEEQESKGEDVLWDLNAVCIGSLISVLNLHLVIASLANSLISYTFFLSYTFFFDMWHAHISLLSNFIIRPNFP